MQALAGPARQTTPGRGSVVVQRHALDEHAPGLAGPCQVACAEGDVTSFLEWAAEGDRAAALCALRCAQPPLHASRLHRDALGNHAEGQSLILLLYVDACVRTGVSSLRQPASGTGAEALWGPAKWSLRHSCTALSGNASTQDHVHHLVYARQFIVPHVNSSFLTTQVWRRADGASSGLGRGPAGRARAGG
jgi:hypothetical protein